MKFYDVESEFSFGKYEGKTLQEVFEKDPKYIDFCFNNYDEFYVSPDVMKELRNLNLQAASPVLDDTDDLNDDELDSFFDEVEEVNDLEPENFNEEELDWENDDISAITDDDFESFDDFDDDDDY
ncbi:MAG: hypothetical protein HOO86_10885 [Bacteroidales bacterium]|nr:hypothetical protein [Bacteroidales bacterium]